MLKSSNIRIMLHFGVRRFSVTRKSLGLERQTKATERVLIINRRNILKCSKFILFVTEFLLETIFPWYFVCVYCSTIYVEIPFFWQAADMLISVKCFPTIQKSDLAVHYLLYYRKDLSCFALQCIFEEKQNPSLSLLIVLYSIDPTTDMNLHANLSLWCESQAFFIGPKGASQTPLQFRL